MIAALVELTLAGAVMFDTMLVLLPDIVTLAPTVCATGAEATIVEFATERLVKIFEELFMVTRNEEPRRVAFSQVRMAQATMERQTAMNANIISLRSCFSNEMKT